jgi:hypothetical protein
MTRLLSRLTGIYIASWLILGWTVLAFSAGAVSMFFAILAACPPEVRGMVL